MNIFKKAKSLYKEHLSYKHKLFIPLAGMLWVLIVIFAIVQSGRIRELKRSFIINQVDLISSRFLMLYDHNENLKPFAEFLDRYFDDTMYDDVSVAVYDVVTGEQLADIGFDAPRPQGVPLMQGSVSGGKLNEQFSLNLDPSRTFYYQETPSSDKSIVVQVILPFNDEIRREVAGNPFWWALIILAGGLMTVVIYLTASHLAKNVKLMQLFAEQAADGIDFDTQEKFGNDELGEIAKRITEIYRSRQAAQTARELEHGIAIKATEERASMKRQLTNNISHELKTPVGVIRGYIDTLVENPDMDESSRTHFLTKAQAHVERLCNLLNDLSTMTRLDDGISNITLEDVDFNALVDGIKHDIEESGIAKGMTFKIDIPDGIFVKANTALLNGALMNLAKNAINYSQGTEMGIKLLTQNKRIITFVFYDNGTGVDEEHIPHLFERFYRVDKGRSRKAGGTGLGLPIVRSSFNSMDGSITVRNSAEGGLEFVFALKLSGYTGDDTDDIE